MPILPMDLAVAMRVEVEEAEVLRTIKLGLDKDD
jgi:hypothetical protein